MKGGNMIKLTGGIIALVMLVAGSGVGTHIGSGAAKAVATCGDLVKCSRADYVLKVNNTGEGNALVAKGQSSSTNKAAVKGEATKRARGVYGKSKKGVGVFGESTTSHGIKGVTNSSNYDKAAVYGISTDNARGVYGKHSTSGDYGYLGTSGKGVYGKSTDGYGVHGDSTTGYGVYGYSGGGRGVYGSSGSGTGVYARSGSGDLIEAWDANPSNRRFRVTNAGDVYCDGSLYETGADFADMSPAVLGLEPADVLVIGPDGKLARSSEAYSTAVAGVYSTRPGFVGGVGDEGDATGKVPLAIVGIVPVKASAENGTICPGDLLTTSGTPGHAMKATEMRLGTVIGKALELLETGTGTIKMLVTLQ